MEDFPVLSSLLSSPSLSASKTKSLSDALMEAKIEDEDMVAKKQELLDKYSRFKVSAVTPKETRMKSEFNVFDKSHGRKFSPGFEHDNFKPAFARRLEDEYNNTCNGERADIVSSIRDEYCAKGWGDGATDSTGWAYRPSTESTGYGFVQDNFLLGNTGTDKVTNFGNWIQEDYTCLKDGVGPLTNQDWLGFENEFLPNKNDASQGEFRPLRRMDRATDFVNWKLDEYRPLSRREGNITNKDQDKDEDCSGEKTDFLRKMSDDFKHFRQMKKRRPSRTSTGSTSSESSGRRRHSAGNLNQDFV